MKITNYLRYGLRDTFRALWRHKAMVAVTVLTVAITFMVLGAAVLISANGQYIEQNLENDMEIVVFLDTDVTVDERGSSRRSSRWTVSTVCAMSLKMRRLRLWVSVSVEKRD